MLDMCHHPIQPRTLRQQAATEPEGCCPPDREKTVRKALHKELTTFDSMLLLLLPIPNFPLPKHVPYIVCSALLLLLPSLNQKATILMFVCCGFTSFPRCFSSLTLHHILSLGRLSKSSLVSLCIQKRHTVSFSSPYEHADCTQGCCQ
jgi:hypothetical protein